MQQSNSFKFFPAMLAGFLFLIGGCSGGSSNIPFLHQNQGTAPSAGTLLSTKVEYVSVVDDNGVPYTGTFASGAVPQASLDAAPTLDPDTTSASIVPGGEALVTVQVPTNTDAVLVSLDGLSGYYRIDVTPEASSRSRSVGSYKTTPDSIVRVSPGGGARSRLRSTPSARTLDIGAILTTDVSTTDALQLNVAYAQGNNVSKPVVVPIYPKNGQAGKYLQITCNWKNQADVDLHVVTAQGNEISYLNREADGGTLDVDSYAGCSADANKGKVENVFWDTPASGGTYTISAVLFSNCEGVETQADLTVRVLNQVAAVYRNTQLGVQIKGFVIQQASILSDLPDNDLLKWLVFNEPFGPANTHYNQADAEACMRAVRAGIYNRLLHPQSFEARGAVTARDILRLGGQFQGFDSVGNPKPGVIRNAASKLWPVGQASTDAFWNAGINIADSGGSDPFAGIKSINGKSVLGGVYGWQQVGTNIKGSLFVKIPNGVLSGNQFYTVSHY